MRDNTLFGEPARGCDLCLRGAKSVLFVTGLCNVRCFYCPVSSERFGKDVIYIDDVPLRSSDHLVKYVGKVGAVGIAVTGGEPLLVIDRVTKFVKELKKSFGPEFHVHIYVHAMSLNRENAAKLASSFVDEVRIHAIDSAQVDGKVDLIEVLKGCGKSVGLEVPAIPGNVEGIVGVATLLKDVVSFVNVNELDVSERNAEELVRRGYVVKRGRVVDSLRTAFRIAERIAPFAPVNVCTTASKDKRQLSARLFRQSLLTARPYEYVMPDGSTAYIKTNEGPAHIRSTARGRVNVVVRIGGELKVYEEP